MSTERNWLARLERTGELREVLTADAAQRRNFLEVVWDDPEVRAEFNGDYAAFTAFVQNVIDELAPFGWPVVAGDPVGTSARLVPRPLRAPGAVREDPWLRFVEDPDPPAAGDGVSTAISPWYRTFSWGP